MGLQRTQAESQAPTGNGRTTRRTHAPSGLSWSTIFWILHLFPGYLCFFLGMRFLLDRTEHHPVVAVGLLVCCFSFALIAGLLERWEAD
jgi:hypothetical protein